MAKLGMMTPGFAKPRAELPWLPYPEKDRMFVINSHNFPTGPANIGFGDELLILRGPTGVTDQSSAGNNGTYNGGMGTVSDTGSGGTEAFLFDGIDDVISFSAITLPAEWTLGFWIKPTTNGTNDGYFHPGSGTTRTCFQAGGAQYREGTFAVAAGTPTIGAWSFIAFSRNAAGLVSAYFNGSFVTSATRANITSLTLFGNDPAAAGRFFDGRADDMRISPIRTAGEISDWYAGGRGYNAP